MTDAQTAGLVVYGSVAVATFIWFTLEWGMQSRYSPDKTKYARLALAAPLWPVSFIYLFSQMFVDLVRSAVGR